MRKLLLSLTVITALSMTSATVFAGNYHSGKKMGFIDKVCTIIPGFCAKMKEKHGNHPPNAKPIPEIDAANAGLALALIGGLVAVRRERRIRKA